MPNDTAPAWDGVPLNPEKDGAHAVEDRDGSVLVLLWRDPWWIGPLGASSKPSELIARGVRYLGPCLTPSEVTARERAAFAAGAEAMREAAAQYAEREEAYSSKRANTDNQHDQVWFSSSEATAGSIASHIRALPLPTDAAAALAEVVRKAKEEEREACAAWFDKEAQKGLVMITSDAAAATIRARSTEGGA